MHLALILSWIYCPSVLSTISDQIPHFPILSLHPCSFRVRIPILELHSNQTGFNQTHISEQDLLKQTLSD